MLNNPADISNVELELAHKSRLFPDLASDIDLTCVLTAGTSKAYGTWAELTDGSNLLSTIVESHRIHVSAVRIRAASVADKLYVIELGYGPSAGNVAVVSPHDFGSGTKQIDSDEQVKVRAPAIPKGQKVYGRLKCETDEATATIVLRYHYEEP